MKMQLLAMIPIKFLYSWQMVISMNLSSQQKKRSPNKLLNLSFKNYMLKKLFLYPALFIMGASLHAQELQGKVTVFAQQVGSSVDKSAFTALQNQLTSFISNRKWTNDVFQAQEKIRCNFLLTIQSIDQDNIYKASLAIQAARPVYNSSYQTALI